MSSEENEIKIYGARPAIDADPFKVTNSTDGCTYYYAQASGGYSELYLTPGYPYAQLWGGWLSGYNSGSLDQTMDLRIYNLDTAQTTYLLRQTIPAGEVLYMHFNIPWGVLLSFIDSFRVVSSDVTLVANAGILIGE